MNRLLKWTGALVGLLVLCLLSGILAVTLLLDPNQFKPLIISEFKQFSGFELKIPGKLSWSFFPHIGVTADEVQVEKPAVFTSNLKNLTLRLKLAPLLHRQIELSKISIDALQINQVQALNVKAKVKLKDNVLQIQPVTADFYQGDLRSEAEISLNQGQPDLSINSKLKNVDMALLMKGLAGKNKASLYFDGRGNITLDVATQGKETQDLLKHLNGDTRFSLDKGIVKGLDIGYYVETAMALINNQPLPTRQPGAQTEFGQLTGTASIKDGIVYNKDLLLDSPLYTVHGEGSLNLVNRTLDYNLHVSLKTEKMDGKVLSLNGKTIPIRVTGDLDKPTISLDTLALAQEVGKEQLEKVGQQIQQALPDKANKFIQNLFH